jgi:hypothetical protein
MSRCASGKRVYDRPEWAEEALLEAHIVYQYPPEKGPVSFYLCDECGGYHLTSKGPMNERLAAAVKDGSLRRLQEANRWRDRLK